MKHAKFETPLERADRLIAELQGDAFVNGVHRSDMVYLEITPQLVRMQERINRMAADFARFNADNMSAIQWHINNPIRRIEATK